MWDVITSLLSKRRGVAPDREIPAIKTDLKHYHSKTPSIIWFGHSSYLIHIDGVNILVDPVLSGHASPVSFVTRAFAGSDLYKAADMPDSIDYLIITHNHYDHLDLDTIKVLAPRVRRVILPSGVREDLERIPIPADAITELDWWETTELTPGSSITATPARHFSGRGLRRNGSLWSSYVLNFGGYTLFIGGDSGYDTHFKEIGNRFGPFDIALLECGQYDMMWPYIHSMPEEVVTEALELQARLVMPVHWGKFALAKHTWAEPIQRFIRAAQHAGVPYATPRIGEPVVLGEMCQHHHWWEL